MRLRLHKMNFRAAALSVLILAPAALFSQSAPGTIPAGTPLALSIDRHYPMRDGQPIRAHLLYPIYVDNELLLPANTTISGSVVELEPDHSRRVRAILGGDFTPFRTSEVRFTQILLADGTSVPLAAGTAVKGAPIYRAVTPPPAKGGPIRRQFDSGLTAARGDLAAFIGPGKGDRLLQFIYSQIPYHPQRIEKGTSWTIETTAAVEVPAQPAPPSPPPAAPARKPHFWEVQTPEAPRPNADSGAWIVQANLDNPLSSETSTKGQAIKAIVAEPIFNPDHTVAVPQGAMLVGTVNRARPARRFGRSGVLSFDFSQLVLPNQEAQTVATRLTGADSAQNIALNSEGQAKSKPQDKIAIPLLLALMAARPLDQDHRDHQLAKNGTGGAAGLGLIGTIIGLAGGSPYAAAGIGYWGASRAFYSRWIARGQKITFAKDTRIVVETTPRRSAPIKPDAQRNR
jgi:hypothetical protein